MKNSNNEKTNFKEHFKWGFRDIFTTKGIWIFLIVTFFFTFLQPFLDYVAGGGYASEDTSIMGGIIVGAGTNANIFIVMFASLIVWKDYKTGYVYQLESVWQKLSYFITKIVFLVIFAVLTQACYLLWSTLFNLMTASGKFYLPEYDAVKFTKKQVLLAFPIECFRAITVGGVAMAFAHAVKRWYISVPVSFVYAILSLNAPEAVYFAVAFFAELFGGSADIIERMPMNMKYYDMVGTQYLGDANIGAIIITFICVIVFSVGIAYFILWLNKKFKNRLKKSED